MRGKRVSFVDVVTCVRLIPAGAGKTQTLIKYASKSAAHPRRCGENLDGQTRPAQNPGSSPQVRGKLVISSPFSMRVRLIPAGAGKTDNFSSSQTFAPAHPRRCGENLPEGTDIAGFFGSSPQVRGKRGWRISVPFSFRLIPAGAGKTSTL